MQGIEPFGIPTGKPVSVGGVVELALVKMNTELPFGFGVAWKSGSTSMPRSNDNADGQVLTTKTSSESWGGLVFCVLPAFGPCAKSFTLSGRAKAASD